MSLNSRGREKKVVGIDVDRALLLLLVEALKSGDAGALRLGVDHEIGALQH